MQNAKTKAGGNILFDIEDSQIVMSDHYTMFDGSSVSNSIIAAGLNSGTTPLKQKERERVMHRYIAIELKKPTHGQSEWKQFHIFLVQHNWNNIDRLVNFINYHRLGICTKID